MPETSVTLDEIAGRLDALEDLVAFTIATLHYNAVPPEAAPNMVRQQLIDQYAKYSDEASDARRERTAVQLASLLDRIRDMQRVIPKRLTEPLE